MFVDVILPLALDKKFIYSVTNEVFMSIQPGVRVVVPFGKNKLYTGLVYNKHLNAPELYEAKEVYEVIDQFPIVYSFQLKFWDWISEYYMCSIGEVFRAALPSGLLLESETNLSLNHEGNNCLGEEISDDEYLILEALQSQSSLKIDEVQSILNKKKVFPVIQNLVTKGLLLITDEVKEIYKPKLERLVKLNSVFNESEQLQQIIEKIGKAPKQKELLLSYFQLIAQNNNKVLVKKLLEYSGQSASVLKGLIEKEIFIEYFEQVDRIVFDKNSNQEIVLSEPQNNALTEIKEQFLSKEVVLLHGVTASGKTEMYIKLIEEYIQFDKQVLFLVPEIALTTQLVNRLTAYFGNAIRVYHSKYNTHERIEVWDAACNKNDNAKIIIGVRSAIFLPFSQLGLIIVDEEHEDTYKQQDPSPRYQARDCSIVLAKLYGAKVLLGSATPSVESYFNAKSNKYGLVELKEKYKNIHLPNIQLIDLKDKYFRKRMDGHFSDELIQKINEVLLKKEQVILFQNRRGFSPYMECNSCGHVPQCPNCDVSLTYYKFKSLLKCHYCGHSIAKPTHCHQCQSVEIQAKGFGTEQIEVEINRIFPDYKVARMDQDTTKGKYAFEKLIDAFKNKEIDILIGTQMLAKGLDFENVTLVGVLNADNLLNQPNYRAYERAFQLMVQVSGRSGRSEKAGHVLIQTYNPLHSIIQQVVHSNYEAMFLEQINDRHKFHYSPYFRLIQIRLKHKDYQKLVEGSTWLYNVLKQNVPVEVLGPEEPAINRVRNEYIRIILLKLPNSTNVNFTKKLIKKSLMSFEAIATYRSIKITINVDY